MFTSTLFRSSLRPSIHGHIRSFATAALVTVAGLSAAVPARAATFYEVSGTLGGANPVSAKATFQTSGTTLVLTLENTSTVPTLVPSQVLTSFYFDLLNGGTNGRPVLTLLTGSGNVFRIIGGGTNAQPYLYYPPTTSGSAYQGPQGSPLPSNIKVSAMDDNTWLYRSGLNTALPPNTYFGIGTVGNGAYGGGSGNGFDSKYVNGIDFGIFTGNLANPQGNLLNLTPNLYLVKNSATFTFGADRNLDNVRFPDPYVFGFGTSPDQAITVLPEPEALGLFGAAAAVAAGVTRRRRTPRLAASGPGQRGE